MELVSFTAFPNPEGFFCGQPSAKQLLHYCHYLTLVFLFPLSLEKLFFERAPVSGSPDSSFQSLEIALTSMNKTFVPFHRPATPTTPPPPTPAKLLSTLPVVGIIGVYWRG